ncbi:MAG: hypothetical protein ACYCTB_08865 [bacterium]
MLLLYSPIEFKTSLNSLSPVKSCNFVKRKIKESMALPFSSFSK